MMNLLKRAPVSSVQTIAPASSTTHHITSTAQISLSGNYKANFSRFKEDLANMIKTKLGVDMGNSRLYQNHMLRNLIWFLTALVGVFLIL
jgi:hypothetical protein